MGFFSPEPAYNNPVMIDMKTGAMTPVERRYDLECLARLELENTAMKVQLAGRDARIAMLESQITELLAKMNTLSEQVARLSKNASNSSKPPVERHRQTAQIGPPSGARKAGGQPGHPGANRPLLPPERIDKIVDHYPSHDRSGRPLSGPVVGDPRIYQIFELRDKPVEAIEPSAAKRAGRKL